MGNRQAEFEKEGYSPLVTYEEAIGYAVGMVFCETRMACPLGEDV